MAETLDEVHHCVQYHLARFINAIHDQGESRAAWRAKFIADPSSSATNILDDVYQQKLAQRASRNYIFEIICKNLIEFKPVGEYEYFKTVKFLPFFSEE